jgi:hypothetical protein
VEPKTPYQLVHAGEKNLANADLWHANLAGLDLSGRNFSGARLDSANLSRTNLRHANLSGARLIGTNLRNAVLNDCVADGAYCVGTHFDGSSLIRASFANAVFDGVSMDSADMREADFSNAMFVQSLDFKDVTINEQTLFDGTYIPYGMADNPIFRYYRLIGNRLVRKPELDNEIAGSESHNSVDSSEVQYLVAKSRDTIAEISVHQAGAPPFGSIGHNGPPLDLALTADELASLDSALQNLAEEFVSREPDRKKIEEARESSATAYKKLSEWLKGKSDLAAEEFAKEIGKQLAMPHNLALLYLTLTGQLKELIQTMSTYLLS